MAVGMTYNDNQNSGIMNLPEPTKEPGERSLSAEDILFTRWVSPWTLPNNATAAQWRYWVMLQPVAMICRETLTANILALDWEIVPREAKYRDELSPTIKHYTKLLENGGNYLAYFGLDYTGLLERILTDLQDLPFGAGAEIGRKNDSPDGRVMWIKPIDGGTLYPTLNSDIPIVQSYNGQIRKFPYWSIARTFMSPRTEITRDGWGMAPPEKITMAMEMLDRGDKYYANLLLDTPPAGILDLGDMEKDPAIQWAKAFRSWSQGNLDAFAIPILYEHTSDAKFIPFGKVPNDLMFDRITLKYAAVVCAGYGVSLGDIGLQSVSSSGETLAGSIRSERKTKRTGFARAKKKIQYFFNRILPDSLEFRLIDLDDELNVSLGRARLANATAGNIWTQMGSFDAKEMRLQALQDGIININIPEDPPKTAVPKNNGKPADRPGLMGYPQNASAGGQGEVKLSTVIKKSRNFDNHVKDFVQNITDMISPVFSETVKGLSEDELYLVRSTVDSSLFGEEDALGLAAIIQNAWKNKSWLRLSFGDISKEFSAFAEKSMESEKVKDVNFDKLGDEFESGITNAVKDFIGRSVIYVLKDLLLIEDAVDDSMVVDYDSIVEQASNKLIEHFDEFVNACVSIETKNIMKKVEEEVRDV